MVVHKEGVEPGIEIWCIAIAAAIIVFHNFAQRCQATVVHEIRFQSDISKAWCFKETTIVLGLGYLETTTVFVDAVDETYSNRMKPSIGERR